MAADLNGKLFVHVWLINNPARKEDTIWAKKDYYVVKGGSVFSLSGKKLTASGDTIESLVRDCHCLGVYDDTQEYDGKLQEFTITQVMNKLKLH